MKHLTPSAEPRRGALSSRPPSVVDRYELKERLGGGEHSEVFRAWDRELQVERAVKVFRLDGSESENNQRKRFLSGARALAKLAHANIAAVYDVDDQAGYLVMDLISGRSLHEEVGECGPFEVREAVRIALGVVDALGALHELQMVHRDVHPKNILLNDNNTPILVDFGIILDPTFRMTMQGEELGSSSTVPPEQRVDSGSVDARADIYSLASTVYFLVTGSACGELYLEDLKGPRWQAVPANIRKVLFQATRANPKDRQENIAIFGAELNRSLGLDEISEPLQLEDTFRELTDEGPTPMVVRVANPLIVGVVVLLLCLALVFFALT